MKVSLIICTYMRAKALSMLLESIMKQSLIPNEILIIDGSIDTETFNMLKAFQQKEIKYYKVDNKDRGLTRQRNFGISNVSKDIDIVCFLDDDIVLKETYFENLISTYIKRDDVSGVGGYIINEVHWRKSKEVEKATNKEYSYEGYIRPLGARNKIRRIVGLFSDKPPGIMPEFSNGLSISFLPPSGKIYSVEYFMGGVSSFRKEVVDDVKFSTYFEGYGLYEDLDYCLRVSKKYKLFVNTSAELYHYHDDSGRPNKYSYGKMVVRNGWYVWRVKYPNPSIKARFKWNCIILLLTTIKLLNVVSTNKRKEAFTEFVGRVVGWISLIFNKPLHR
ncbi:MAG: glycosyltransferase family 2 protein [Flavobacteriaceae bacterium]